ncbi:MAG: 1,4-alpha-glucan branching protein GlgB [Clostridia bacterium]|nr:1,4-alpha-glucan branching protein GlgB [Clostridia bacterium]
MSLTQISNDIGISEYQLYLFNEGTNFQSYEFLGAHKIDKGWRFAVWAPNAKAVYITGDFNGWNNKSHPLYKLGSTGVWATVLDCIKEKDFYKYAIEDQKGNIVLKADPFAFYSEVRPSSASVVCDTSGFVWEDSKWLEKRKKTPPYDKPMVIYELHAGSWRRHEDGSFLTYRELADQLCDYLIDMGYTHVEFMPVCEYPFDGSWGYQVTGFFSPTSRYGTVEDLKYAVNKFHKAGIHVIMDWVGAHFPRDGFGLYRFDGTPTYEYADARLGEHKDWGTMVFDYSKGEVVSFLLSSAYYWVKEFHFDGLRVDAVSSMLYRDYSRNAGEWLPNIYGGNQNLEAISFLQTLNKIMFANFPNILMIAEESTAWPKVTVPTDQGGLGFNYKWNMGWMNDTLRYMSMDPLFRKPNHNLLTFLMFYAFSENFILPLSHDEVVHGKHSLIDKMYGNYDEKFESYKTLLGYYMALPGKKLLFMGGEFGQFLEWRFAEQLEWNVLEIDKHAKLKEYVKQLNHFYTANKAFWQIDNSWDGFEWINDHDSENSVLSFMRKGQARGDYTIVVSNFTPVNRKGYKIGVPQTGEYEIVFRSSDVKFGGSGSSRKKNAKAKKEKFDSFNYTIQFDISGLSTVYIKRKKQQRQKTKKTEETKK